MTNYPKIRTGKGFQMIPRFIAARQQREEQGDFFPALASLTAAA